MKRNKSFPSSESIQPEPSLPLDRDNSYVDETELKKAQEASPALSMIPSERLSILRKLHAIMEQAGYIEKTGWRADQKWKYVSDADVLKTVRKYLVQKKIMVVPNLLKMWTLDLGLQGARGFICYTVIRWDFIDVENGSCLSVTMPGGGYDVQSTGVYKAITGSDKYVLLKVLQFVTGDDAEAENLGSEERRTAEMNREASKGVDIPGATKVEHTGEPPQYNDEDFEPWDYRKPRPDVDEFGNDFAKVGPDWWKDVPMKACAAFEKLKPGKKISEIGANYLCEMANRWVPHVDDEHAAYRGVECRKLAAACKERLRVEMAAGTIMKRDEPLADGTVKVVYYLQEQPQKK